MDAVGRDDDVDGAVSFFVEVRAFRFVVVVGLVGVGEVHVTGAKYLELVMEIRSGGEYLCTKTGAGIINFEQQDGLAGVIADRGEDVVRMAAADSDDEKEAEEQGGNARETQAAHGTRVTGRQCIFIDGV